MFHFRIYIFIYRSSHRQVFVRNVGVNLLYNKVRHFKRLKSSAAHTERFQTMLSSHCLMGFMKCTTLEQKNKFTSRHYYRAITKIKPFSTRLKQLEMRHQGFILQMNSESCSGHFELQYSPHVCASASICKLLLFYFYSICLLWPFSQLQPCRPYACLNINWELCTMAPLEEDLRKIIERTSELWRRKTAEKRKWILCSLSLYSTKSTLKFQLALWQKHK